MEQAALELQRLAARVGKLEQQNRLFKKIGIVLVVFTSYLIVLGQAASKKTIVANEFVLQDALGKTRARPSMEANDRPTLNFYRAPTSRDPTSLDVSLVGGDEPFISLHRAGTPQQVQLGANNNFVGLAIYDKEIRAGVYLQKDVSGLDLFDQAGEPQASLNASKSGPSFNLFGPGSKGFILMDIDQFGKSSLQVEDKDGFSVTVGKHKPPRTQYWTKREHFGCGHNSVRQRPKGALVSAIVTKFHVHCTRATTES